ncbi:MAG: hypothetical protein E6Q66_06435 [Pedobacter sp.]|jgi:glutathione-regulated potassium-efflux system ancillary protein KefG|nr:MAG: hypothetical protein E6Q66_06435 [Pedobacter sp.]
MKNLLILAHPNLSQSFSNKRIVEGLQGSPNLKIKDLYAEYPGFNINVEKEQADLLVHDRVIFQFPMYWYSTPALLKEWQDVVLTSGFAYSFSDSLDEYKLKGKKLLLSVTAAGPWDAYQPNGKNRFTVEELLRPLNQSAYYCKMIFETPIVSHEMLNHIPEKIPEVEKRIVAHVEKLKKVII